jgi:hypothetical protein
MEDIPLILPPLENISKEQIEIWHHAYDKISGDRKIKELWVHNCLISGNKQ